LSLLIASINSLLPGNLDKAFISSFKWSLALEANPLVYKETFSSSGYSLLDLLRGFFFSSSGFFCLSFLSLGRLSFFTTGAPGKIPGGSFIGSGSLVSSNLKLTE
jgi:hypothetical protein